MSDDFSFDLSEFRRAMDEVSRATKKDEVTILNRAALTAVIGGKGVKGAVQRTPRADAAKIAGLTRRQLVASVIRRAKQKGEWPLSSKEVNARIKAEKARRRRSIAYTAGPGWNQAAKAFGGRGVRGVQSGFAQSKASKGYGKKASGGELEAVIANTAPAADAIGREALQDALNDTARDMIQYAARKMGKTFANHSAR